MNAVGNSVGNCITDSFSMSVPGGVAPPGICGLNTGQHLYVDASGCSTMNFNIGTGTAATRSWSLKVVQLECTNRLTGRYHFNLLLSGISTLHAYKI